jgi:hypothetical protein
LIDGRVATVAKVNYVACSSCNKEYYIERMLSNALAANPDLNLKCPYCKQEFNLGQNDDSKLSHDSKAGASKHR